ncbi:hypothetical protein ACFY9Y_26710 [Streptomyces fimicarius]|uniref:hypothetical protein n=1 Tax=Streptomyces griseus TaxID=1911 RepID=UPI0036E80B6B
MAAGVEHAVAKNIARIQAEGTDRWADLLRTTLPESLIRDAILASPAWPDIAAYMGRLHGQGVDVARILTDAHAAGLGVDQAIAAAAAPAPASAAAAPVPGAGPRRPLPRRSPPHRSPPPLLLRPPRRPLPARRRSPTPGPPRR